MSPRTVTAREAELKVGDLKPGDRALIRRGGVWTYVEVAKVTRTQVVVSGGARFVRDTGVEYGSGDWPRRGTGYLYAATDALVAELEQGV